MTSNDDNDNCDFKKSLDFMVTVIGLYFRVIEDTFNY